jgi:uncharacterized protein
MMGSAPIDDGIRGLWKTSAGVTNGDFPLKPKSGLSGPPADLSSFQLVDRSNVGIIARAAVGIHVSPDCVKKFSETCADAIAYLSAARIGPTMRSRVAYLGRGALNLVVFVLLAVFGLQNLIGPRIAMSIALVGLYLAGVRWIEGREPSELLYRTGPTEFAAGFALGFGLFAALMVLLWMLGAYRPSGLGSVAPLAAGFLSCVQPAIFEEIVFRGFLYRLSAKLLGTWGGLALTSVLFGAAHAFNAGATVGSSVAIALEAGVLLGAAFALTQRLWLPIGLHLAWNFAEGNIFGMSVSGGEPKASLIVGTLRGRDLLTGGLFGPEASMVAVIICLGAALFLLSRAVRRGRLESPVWARIPEVQHPVLGGPTHPADCG